MYSMTKTALVIVGLTASTSVFAGPSNTFAEREGRSQMGLTHRAHTSRASHGRTKTSRASSSVSTGARALATEIAKSHGVSPALVHAVMTVESGGNCRATSSANAQGAMQVKPQTARGVGVSGSLHDCRTGITAGVRYLKEALRVNGGNICAAASSYNTGTGITGRCSGYGRKVVSLLGRMTSWTSLTD